MKNLLSRNGFVAAATVFAIVLFSTLFAANPVKAQTTTFAQFVEQSGSQDFVFSNNGASGNFNTVPGGSPIFFFYQNVNNLPAALQGPQFARMTVATTTTTPAGLSGGNLAQPLNQTVTISITRDTPAPAGTGGGARTNLLTAVITTNVSAPDLNGSTNGNSATLSATTPNQNVVFTSDFLSFALTTQRNLGLSFSSVTPSLSQGGGGFLQSFTAAATGTFASNPAPVYAPPTAAGVTVSGRILSSSSAPVSRATVTLTESNGTVHQIKTGSFGFFEFPDISAGQTIVINVSAPRYASQAQVLSLADNIADLNFYLAQ